MPKFYDLNQLEKLIENGIELKIKCNCCVGIQSTTWESWEVFVNDFYNDFVDIYREVIFHNYCYKCGKKIDIKKYKKLLKKLRKQDEGV